MLKSFLSYFPSTSSLRSPLMAAALGPRLSPQAETPNDIDFVRLCSFMEEYFSRFRDSTVRLFANIESSDICPHILRYRLCPSLFSDYVCHSAYHPEFLVRHGQILWLPRTWICKALQRAINWDGSGTMQCPIDQCPYMQVFFVVLSMGNWRRFWVDQIVGHVAFFDVRRFLSGHKLQGQLGAGVVKNLENVTSRKMRRPLGQGG